jgi:protein involved in polysaccharide export with SLBB domain/biopolymer transport protein ExbD
VVRWFYFYQPLVWRLRRQLQLCQDFLADAASARAGSAAEDYAEFLTSCSSTCFPPPLAAGLGIGGRVSDLHRRVVMLVENRRPLESASPRSWNYLAVPIAIALIAVVASLGNRPASVAAEPDQNVAPAKAAIADAPAEPAKPAGPAQPAKPVAETQPEAPVGPVAQETPTSEPVELAPEKATTSPSDSTIELELDRDPVIVRLNEKLGTLGDQLIDEESVLSDGDSKVRYSALRKKISLTENAIDERKALMRPRVAELLAERASAAKEPAGASWRQAPTAPIAARRTASAKPHRVTAGDVVSIDVMSNLDSTQGIQLLLRPSFTAPVDSGGLLSLGPHYGLLPVSGMTLSELEGNIAQRLKERVDRDIKIKRVHDKNAKVPTGPIQINVQATFLETVEDQLATSMEKAAPKGPKLIAPLDILHIEVSGLSVAEGFPGTGIVESDGELALGARFGRVNVLGKSLSEAEELISKKLMNDLKDPLVQVTYAGRATDESASDRSGAAAIAQVRKLEREILELKQQIQLLKNAPKSDGKKNTNNRGEPSSIHLSLRQQETGTPALYLNDQPTSEGALRKLLGTTPDRHPYIFLAADKQVPYTEVVKVIDMLGAIGLHNISLDTKQAPRY